MLKQTQRDSWPVTWPVVGAVKNPQLPAQEQLRPYFPMGSGVTLRSMYARSAKPTPSGPHSWDTDGDYLKTAAGPPPNRGFDPHPQDLKPPAVQSRGVLGQLAAADTSWRVSGETYTAYAPAPLRAPRADGGNPQLSNLLWRFKFSGECLNGEPLLYLFTQDEKMVLCGFDGGPAKFASLIPKENGVVEGTAATKWLLRPAMPSGRAKLPPAANQQPPPQKGMVQTVQPQVGKVSCRRSRDAYS